MRKKTIYFAHPQETMGSKRERQIVSILESRGYEVINPFEKEEALVEKYGVKNYYEKPTEEFAIEITVGDYYLVEICDEYFGWFPEKTPAIGTSLELARAERFDKKITAIYNKPHPFLWKHCDVLYLGFKEFVDDDKFIEKKKEIEIKNIILEKLIRDGQLNRTELCLSLKIPSSTIHHNLEKLERIGAIERVEIKNGHVGRPIIYWTVKTGGD
jgi:hypothetical protein